MNLRKKTLLFMAATVLLILAVNASVANTIFLENYRQLERQDILNDVQRFDKALDHEIQRLSALTYDWSSWDDTYRFMMGDNPHYISSNLSLNTLNNLELSFIVFFDPDQNPHLIRTISLESAGSFISAFDLNELKKTHPELIPPKNVLASVSGIAEIAGRPVLVASQPILTSQGEGPVAGRLVFGRILSGSLLQHLQDMTGEDIHIIPLDSPSFITAQLESATQDLVQGEVLVQIPNPNMISALSPIRDIRYETKYLMSIEKARLIYQQGRASMLRMGFSLALAGLAGGVAVMLILDRSVVSKLTRLNTAVREIRKEGYHGQALVIQGDDEISSLSGEIEKAFKDLSKAHTDINNHLDFQRLLVHLSTAFINLPIDRINDQIQKTLEIIGEIAGADRSYVFLRRENETHIVDNTYEWCRRGIQPVKSMLQGIEESSLPWWFKRLKHGDTILIPCIADLPDQAAAERELLLAQSIQSLAAVPLQANGQLIGFLGFDIVQKEICFSEHILTLLGIVGNIIANAIDHQQREERLASNQMVQYQLNRITRASIEKDDFRSTALALSKELKGLIRSDRGILVLFESDRTLAVFDSGKQWKTMKINLQNWFEFLTVQQEYIFIHEGHCTKETPHFIRQLGVGACMIIPLVSEQKILGMALLTDDKPRTYTREEAAICQQAGPQITLAILKVQALEAARRHSQELNALRATIADINSELGLDKLLRTMLERAARLAHADGGEICVFDEEHQALQVVASYNLDKDYSGTSMSIGEGAGGIAVRIKKTFIVKDYATWPGRMPSYQGTTFHATIVTPLMIGERILGTISLLHFKPDRQFSKDDQHILSLFAQHAAIAMENAILFEKVQELARTDTVTGLLNRRALREIGDYEVARAQRLNHPIAVAMIDLDDFKIINDTYSHKVGDSVLQEVARLCRENIRNIDIISRYGGDEFVVVMPATDQGSALRVSRRLQRALENHPIQVNGKSYIARFSIGLTVHSHQPPSLDELLTQADEAMYEAKNSGKNRVCVYQQKRKEPK